MPEIFDELNLMSRNNTSPVLTALSDIYLNLQDEMRGKVNALSKLYDISMNKAKTQKALINVLFHSDHNYKVNINLLKKCVMKCCCVKQVRFTFSITND